jgi:hypothetical protein
MFALKYTQLLTERYDFKSETATRPEKHTDAAEEP